MLHNSGTDIGVGLKIDALGTVEGYDGMGFPPYGEFQHAQGRGHYEGGVHEGVVMGRFVGDEVGVALIYFFKGAFGACVFRDSADAQEVSFLLMTFKIAEHGGTIPENFLFRDAQIIGKGSPWCACHAIDDGISRRRSDPQVWVCVFCEGDEVALAFKSYHLDVFSKIDDAVIPGCPGGHPEARGGAFVQAEGDHEGFGFWFRDDGVGGAEEAGDEQGEGEGKD